MSSRPCLQRTKAGLGLVWGWGEDGGRSGSGVGWGGLGRGWGRAGVGWAEAGVGWGSVVDHLPNI